MYIIKLPYVHMQYRPNKTQRWHQSKPQKLTPARSALCLLWVCFLKNCVSSKSAMVYSGSALGVRFTHCSVVQTHHFSYHLDLRVYFWNRVCFQCPLWISLGAYCLGSALGWPQQTQSRPWAWRHRKQTQSLVEVCFNSVRLGLIGRVKMRLHFRTTQCIGCIYFPGIG